MISTGTKSLLFGAHWPPHIAQVILAWRWIYGSFPTAKQCLAICLHDVGYLGVQQMDGADGTLHPELGAKLADKLLGLDYGDLIRGHSKGYADSVGIERSKLYAADKAAHALVWSRSYVLRTRMTGELSQYRSTGPGGVARAWSTASDIMWFRALRAWIVKEGLQHAVRNLDPTGSILHAEK